MHFGSCSEIELSFLNSILILEHFRMCTRAKLQYFVLSLAKKAKKIEFLAYFSTNFPTRIKNSQRQICSKMKKYAIGLTFGQPDTYKVG